MNDLRIEAYKKWKEAEPISKIKIGKTLFVSFTDTGIKIERKNPSSLELTTPQIIWLDLSELEEFRKFILE